MNSSPPPYPQQSPPPMGYTMPGAYQPTRTSGAAITSLITGILGCFIITGLVAVITGIVGLRATRDPQVKGRGMAIAGLILGLITMTFGVLFVGGLGVVGYAAYKEIQPAYAAGSAFANAASTGDIDKAMNFVDTNRISRTEVQRIVDDLRALGPVKEVKPGSPNVQMINGVTTIDFECTLLYDNSASRDLRVQILKQPDGSYKASKLTLQ